MPCAPAAQATVIRDGVTSTVDSRELVPGDVVLVEAGDAVPADIRLIECAQCEADESVLTGESVPVAKTVERISARTRRLPLGDCHGNLFMATAVVAGRAKGVVVRTGTQTEIGRIAAAVTATSRGATPLQRKLQRLGMWLVLVSVVLCGIVIGAGIARGQDRGAMIRAGLRYAGPLAPPPFPAALAWREGIASSVSQLAGAGFARRCAYRQPGGVGDPRGPRGGDDGGDGHWRAPHGRAAAARAQAPLRRVPWLRHVHLHRQGRGHGEGRRTDAAAASGGRPLTWASPTPR